MGKIWQSTDGIELANLNSPLTFDARVSADVAETIGSTYATVAAALSGGAKSIYVDPGTYSAGFSVDSPGVYILCGSPTTGSGGVASTVFQGEITVSAPYVTIVNAHRVGGTDQVGFRVYRGINCVRLLDCTAYGMLGIGFCLNDSAGAGAASSDCHLSRCVAMASSAGDGFFWADSDYNYDWSAEGCSAISCARDGFSIGAASAEGVSAANKGVSLTGCRATGNTMHGVRVGPHVSACITGGAFRNNSGDGVYIASPGSVLARSQVVGASSTGNAGIGIRIGTSAATQVVVGVQARGNSAALSNCYLCPGYTSGNSNTVEV